MSTIKLADDSRQIELAIRSTNTPDAVQEIDSIIERLIQQKERLLENDQKEQGFRESIREIEDHTNVRIAIKRTSYNRPPKYQYKEQNEWKTWAGVGKMPLGLKQLITVDGVMDKSLLEKFLIIKDDNAEYQFRDRTGMIRTWSGKGKKPIDLQLLLDKGYKLEQFATKSH